MLCRGRRAGVGLGSASALRGDYAMRSFARSYAWRYAVQNECPRGLEAQLVARLAGPTMSPPLRHGQFRATLL
eukprot:9104078-Pyramimonas_sp.AAC.1